MLSLVGSFFMGCPSRVGDLFAGWAEVRGIKVILEEIKVEIASISI